MKKAFTLAEVMIVLTVIGVLTAILLPVARQSMPDENLMKFKKAHNTLGTVIRELVTSDKYYLDGDLGVKPDSNLVDSATYFCETIADVLNVKNSNCSSINTKNRKYNILQYATSTSSYANTREEVAIQADEACREVSSQVGPELILNDDVVLYNANPKYHFGITWGESGAIEETSSSCSDESGNNFCNDRQFIHHTDNQGFNRIYKIFCIDIDGIDSGEDPFGYGIRVDGKILTGARATEWLARDVNEE
ncbi:MAG: type II secretion system protein [Cyanobacteria bacterium SIG27]|nr:type II secretion system protein [Cyanobacteria bacterium SIG27]